MIDFISATEVPRQETAPWCVTGWTDWFNNSHPDSDSGDYELIADIQAAGGNICDKNQVSKIQCKYIDPVAEGAGVK
jgi:Mucin-2 protein WxxW repeating region